MNATATTTAERRDRREAILEAALELFSERGFHGAAVPAVAERARVGAGTIYRYFESKEALVNALYQREKQRLVAKMTADFPFDADCRTQFGIFFRRAIAFSSTDRKAMLFLELHHHGDYLDETSRALERSVMDLCRAFIEQAQREGLARAMPPDAAIAIVWGALVGLVRSSWEGLLRLDDTNIARSEAALWAAIAA